MSGPVSSNLLQHYGAGPSEVERKMQMVMGQDSSESGVDEPPSSISPMPTSLLSTLRIELVDRILNHVIAPSSSLAAASSRGDDAFASSRRRSEAHKLCLVCRQFDQLTRPRMYRQVVVPVRNMRSFLSTMQRSERLARLVRCLVLDSRIWTNVDENVIVAIFLAVRRHCVSIKVGANESPLLPYLFCGLPAGEGEGGGEESSGDDNCCPALKALDVCWRDEVDVQADQRGGIVQGNGEGQDAADAGGSNPYQEGTLEQLFTHPGHTVSTTALHISHLTLDLYSQAQLSQLFTHRGYFVRMILPKLSFLRIELPLVVLQFKCEKRGGLVDGWPTEDWANHIEELIDARFEQVRRSTATMTIPTESKGEEMGEEDDQVIFMPPCPSHQLKVLTIRFLINVHRNDITVAKLLIPPKALEQSWSTRASIAAHCLTETLQAHLDSNGSSQQPSRPISFSLSEYKRKGAEEYWREKWEEAEVDRIAGLPSEVRGEGSASQTASAPGSATKVTLLLKWPSAVNAFFHYSAMI